MKFNMNFFNIFIKKTNALGINERNLSYIRRYNSKHAIHIADDKLLTKNILSEKGIPTSKLIRVIRTHKALKKIDFKKLPISFVVKPCSGVEGGGIEIFYNRDSKGNYIKASGERWSANDLQNHCRKILDGDYSMNNLPDKIIIEERVKISKDFRNFTYKGTPDIRVIVFNSIPIMSYIRIPTKSSDGKANLALGAIGCGIDLDSGITTTGVIGKSEIITKFPNTNLSVSGIKIPYWNKILKYSILCSRTTGLGFCAVDFLLDKDLGPVVVELNARPGLSIQIANQDSLKWRLKKAKGIKIRGDIDKAIRIAKDLFGGEIQEELEDISGKQIIGKDNTLKIIFEGYQKTFPVKLNLEKKMSSIPLELYYEIAPFLNDGSSSKILDINYKVNDSDKEEVSRFIVNPESDIIILGQNTLKHYLLDLSS